METIDRSDSDNPEETPDPFNSVRIQIAETIRQLYNLVEDQIQALEDTIPLRGGKHSAQISRLINDAFEACEEQSLLLDDLQAQLGREPFDASEILSQVLEVENKINNLNSLIRRIVDPISGKYSQAPSTPPTKRSRKKKPVGEDSADSSEAA